MSVYEMSKCFSLAKVTFLGVQGKGSLFKACQNNVKPIIVFSKTATENDDVIEITQTKLPFETMQYRVHKPFNGRRGIAQTERHDMELKQAV